MSTDTWNVFHNSIFFTFSLKSPFTSPIPSIASVAPFISPTVVAMIQNFDWIGMLQVIKNILYRVGRMSPGFFCITLWLIKNEWGCIICSYSLNLARTDSGSNNNNTLFITLMTKCHFLNLSSLELLFSKVLVMLILE